VATIAIPLVATGYGTVLFSQLGAHRGPLAFIGATDQALLVAVGFLIAAGVAVFWLPKRARREPDPAAGGRAH
jgi:hypothetical protein